MSVAPAEVSPGDRTVGQLVADSIRLYGRRFWRSLALGIGPAILTTVAGGLAYSRWVVLMTTLGSVLLSASYVGAVAVAYEVKLDRRVLRALGVGIVAFLPVPVLIFGAILPALVWLSFVGLVVPVAMLEGPGIVVGFRRAFRLALADYVHALGTLCALAIVVVASIGVLVFLLLGAGRQTAAVAFFLANLILSPLLFLGSALLYRDQAARLESGSPRKRRRDARLHHAVDADRPGCSDAEVEPGQAARGEP
jgi:hypothetical protein